MIAVVSVSSGRYTKTLRDLEARMGITEAIVPTSPISAVGVRWSAAVKESPDQTDAPMVSGDKMNEQDKVEPGKNFVDDIRSWTERLQSRWE